MKRVMTTAELIKLAGQTLGSEYRVAQALEVTPQRVNAWKHGRAKCSPEQQALIAACAGLDPRDHLVAAVLAKHQGTPLGLRLRQALTPGLSGLVPTKRPRRKAALPPSEEPPGDPGGFEG
jgi:hypothetical protein